MATDICTRRLTKELKSLMKDPIRSPTITVAPNEKNILEVHYVIEGSEKTPFAGGIYHGKLLFPKDYPLKPPSVIMITKNGRFQPNRRLCLSMSDFHPEVSYTFCFILFVCHCRHYYNFYYKFNFIPFQSYWCFLGSSPTYSLISMFLLCFVSILS